MKKRINEIGKKYGRLTIINDLEDGVAPGGSHYRMVRCLCDCGNTCSSRLADIKKGHTSSCGCYFKETFIKHGFDCNNSKNKRIYHIYHDIKKRCYNKNCKNYKNYGGRGISMCDKWLHDFTSFATWCLNNGYSDELTIDRINNDGNYEPSNCRWVDAITQGNNRSDNVVIYHNNEKMTLIQWCRKLGLKYSTYKSRRRRGYNIEYSLFTPVNKMSEYARRKNL